jgi:sulfatase modifying factor 1
MRKTSCICSIVVSLVCAMNVQAAPATGRAIEVIDGDTLKIVGVDDSGKPSGNPAVFGIRGVAVPGLDQPFGKQALDRVKELVESKTVIWNGPTPRAYKPGNALFFRTEKGESLALLMISEGLAWVVEAELEDKHRKPTDVKKLDPQAAAWIKAERDAREAKRGLWADKNPMSPWEWRAKVKEVKNSLGMKLLYIPAGKFSMGSPESEPGREPQEIPHEVELTKGFYLGEHEVTVGQFKQFVLDTKHQTDGEKDGKGAYGIDEAGKIQDFNSKFTWKSPGYEQADDHPVVNVSWHDAKAFCLWLSKKEKKTYRLPTEAEWEYACRAGTKTAYAHGDNPEGLATIGNGADGTARAKYPGWTIGIKAKDGHIFTAPVGQFKKNAFGLHDMHGNVWEWCEDWYDPKGYAAGKQIDPTGPAEGTAKVQRGGGWSSDSKRLRSASRVGRDPSAYRGCYLGFRVVLVQSSAETARESAARDADEKAKTAEIVKRVVKAAGGEDKKLKLFQIKESLNLRADPKAKGFERVSVMEPPYHWWVGTNDRVVKESEPAVFLVWAWSLGALTDPKSKLAMLPDIEDGDRNAFGLRVSGTIDPPMDVYFDAKENRLLRIDWRADYYRFSELKELDGLKYPSRTIGYKKKAEGEPWFHSDILEVTRLKELPKGLVREKK